jgi:HK97 family phage prohead protease
MEFKTTPLADAELKFANDKPTFTGYASVFGGVDTYGDTIHPGAFKAAVGDGAEVKMYFNHAWIKRELPIGKMLVKEDARGLFVERGEFTPGLKMADEVALAVRHGTVTGLSIGYRVNEAGVKKKDGGKGRDIYEIDLLKEVSIVDWPADPAALIDMKAAIHEAESLKELENLLRDAAGFSRADATALVSRIKTLTHGDRVAKPEPSELAALILGATRSIVKRI